MTPTTLAETILRDVPRYSEKWSEPGLYPKSDGGWVGYHNVLAALAAAMDPAIAERAGEVVEALRYAADRAAYEPHRHHTAADLITALLAQNAALRAQIAEKERTYDDLYADALADAKSDAQDFDSDLWIEVRKFLTELHLDWRDYADDGITAEQAIEYIRECMDEETRRAEAADAKLAEVEKERDDWIEITARTEDALRRRTRQLADADAKAEAAEATIATLTEKVEAMRGALKYYKDTFCEGFCGEDCWSDEGHSHPDLQRDCSGCLAASVLIRAALSPAPDAREAALHPDDMLPEAIRLIRQEASRDHSQDVVTGLKHIALLLEQLINEART